MENRNRKLLKIGKTDVKYALGFFWRDRHKLYVAATPEDVAHYNAHGYTDADFHPMSELESAFRESTAFKFISWCKFGCIVRQCARQVTFEYDTQKVVLHIR